MIPVEIFTMNPYYAIKSFAIQTKILIVGRKVKLMYVMLLTPYVDPRLKYDKDVLL